MEQYNVIGKWIEKRGKNVIDWERGKEGVFE